jgi:DNA-binding SARP family transcriptional activator
MGPLSLGSDGVLFSLVAANEQPMSVLRFGVLGPIGAWTADGDRLALPGPRQREVLARLLVARGRVVPLAVLIDDLWDEPPTGAAAAVRTFVAALRRALEPGRAPRSRSELVVTEGTGYRVHAANVDAWEFEEHIRADLSGARRIEQLEGALGMWRGPAFDEVADRPWAAGEVAKLAELRLGAVEALARARLRHGRAEEALADLQAHRNEHPNREQAWLLSAQALHEVGRSEDALAVLRRARTRLADEFGLDSSDRIARLEHDILANDTAEPEHDLWRSTATAFAGASPRSLLTASADLLRGLAITNGTGLSRAQSGRAATVDQLRSLDDPELAAQVLVRLEVPGLWSCLDDPVRSAELVSMARACLDQANPATRARLLALIGVESRGTRGTAGLDAALEAETLARELGDPAILVQALNARFLQSFHTIGAWPERAAIAEELLAVSRRHDLSTYEILGHLAGLQAAAAMNDVATADEHAEAADRLGARHERDLVAVFTTWWQALRRTLTNQDSRAAYERALATLPGCGMPGVIRGLAPLTRFCLGRSTDDDFGPNTPYVRPLLSNDRDVLRAAPAPPPDHLAELRWALLGEAALRIGDAHTAQAVRAALAPAEGEWIGAGTGMLSLGPVSELLARLT